MTFEKKKKVPTKYRKQGGDSFAKYNKENTEDDDMETI